MAIPTQPMGHSTKANRTQLIGHSYKCRYMVFILEGTFTCTVPAKEAQLQVGIYRSSLYEKVTSVLTYCTSVLTYSKQLNEWLYNSSLYDSITSVNMCFQLILNSYRYSHTDVCYTTV